MYAILFFFDLEGNNFYSILSEDPSERLNWLLSSAMIMFFFFFTKTLVLALRVFSLMRSVWDLDYMKVFKTLFFNFIHCLTSLFHHGIRGFELLGFRYPIVFLAVSIIISVNLMTVSSILIWLLTRSADVISFSRYFENKGQSGF